MKFKRFYERMDEHYNKTKNISIKTLKLILKELYECLSQKEKDKYYDYYMKILDYDSYQTSIKEISDVLDNHYIENKLMELEARE